MSTSSIGAYEAKTHLPGLLAKVEKGESVTITKHGRPVARLVPVSTRSPAPETVVAALREARTGVYRGAESIRDMVEEGRR
ncbi:MAG: type II toxin-antitoxin system prevent-host-death family antitoxin [Actinobacteria bacterium]|nr:type II toxin-antitoxin system prevent-host-death family antitoxin [Actinomycetota bacterium]